MTIEFFAIGGYEEVGKNMSAVKIDDQIVILDMGIALDKLMLWEESGIEVQDAELSKMKVIPNDSILDKHRDKVCAIVASHAHLDHIGAIGNLAAKYKAPVIGTPFTIELIKETLKEEKGPKPKELIKMNEGEVMELGDISLEFVHTTHSVPQTTFSAIHTHEGVVFYANDYKFDNYQKLSPPPDYKRYQQLGKEGIKACIVESVRVSEPMKTPSEMVAKELIRDTLTETLNADHGILITSFASHIERLNSIVDIAKELGRNIIFAGSSLEKYVNAAERCGIKKFKGVEIFGKSKARKKIFDEAAKNKKDYLFVVTGGQGEPEAVLSRIANGEYNYKITPGDEVIFSCTTIPNPSNIANRDKLESKLRFNGARIFRDVHASGHAGKEDHRDLMHLLEPEHIIPCHGGLDKLASYAELAFELDREMGGQKYILGETVHLMRNGQRLNLSSKKH